MGNRKLIVRPRDVKLKSKKQALSKSNPNQKKHDGSEQNIEKLKVRQTFDAACIAKKIACAAPVSSIENFFCIG